MARKAGPPVRSKRMKAIMLQQHDALVETENDPEFRDYIEMLWETGGSQTDIARLHRRNVDLPNGLRTYSRQKLEHNSQGAAAIAIGGRLREILSRRPSGGGGPYSPNWRRSLKRFALPGSASGRTGSDLPTSVCTVTATRGRNVPKRRECLCAKRWPILAMEAKQFITRIPKRPRLSRCHWNITRRNGRRR